MVIENARPLNVSREIGNSGLNRWGGDIYEEFLPSLRGSRASRIYKEMSSNDPVVTAVLLCTRQLMRGVSWQVQAASDSKVDQEAGEFLKSCLDDMNVTWPNLIDEITTYFEYGWSYHEIVYKRRLGDNKDPSTRSKHSDGRIGWRKLAGRSQDSWDSWDFKVGGDESLSGMWQKTDYMPKAVFIPIEKALLFRTTTVRGNPEGKSFLRGAYRPWYFKKHIEEIEGIGIERDLAGLPVLTTPENVDIWDTNNSLAVTQKTAAENLVKNIRRDKNEGVVLPHGWDLKLLTSGSNRQFDTNQIINRYDQRIAITLLADIIMLGADKVGSFALADAKKSLLASALDAQVTNIVNIFNNYAIPRLFALNAFPGITALPTLSATGVNTPPLKELGEYISRLAGAGMPLFPDDTLENYLRTVADLPEISEASADRKATNNKPETKTEPGGDKVDE